VISRLRERQDGLVVERRLALGTRILGSAAFLVVAARVLSFFGERYPAFLRQASPAELREALPGLLFTAFLFLLFAVPAWLIFFWRARVVLDAGTGTVRDVRHYGLFARRTRATIPFGEVARVRAWRHVIVAKGRSTAYHEAALVLKDGRELPAVKDLERRSTLEIARALARRLDVRLQSDL
jgi:hypothetical protein